MSYDSNTIQGLSITTPTENNSYIPELNDAIREIKRALVYSQAVASISSATYTALTTSSIILADTSSNAITITLPTAASMAGRRYTIKRLSNSYALTIDGYESETIDGSATVTVPQVKTIVSDGTNWETVNEFIDSDTIAFFRNSSAPTGWTIDNSDLTSGQTGRVPVVMHSDDYSGVGGSDNIKSWTTDTQELATASTEENARTTGYPIMKSSGALYVADPGALTANLAATNVNTVTLEAKYVDVLQCKKD